MKVHIDEMHQGGLVLEGDEYKGVQVSYSIVDGETGRSLADQEFSVYEAAEAYVAQHFPGCERWTTPPPSADESAELMRMVEWLEQHPSDLVRAGPTGQGIWARLSHGLHQRSYAPDIVARIRALLARLQ